MIVEPMWRDQGKEAALRVGERAQHAGSVGLGTVPL